MSILDNTAIEQQLLAMGEKKSAGDAPAAPRSDSAASGPQAFVQRYADLAATTGAKLGVAPEVLLGQWGLETGWGKSIIPGTNNLGNIKGKNGPMATDNQTGSRDSYRAYKDDADFGNGFTAFIGNSERYQGALNSGADAGAYFSALKKGGYAEDPAYVQKGVSATRLASQFLGGRALPAGQVSATEAPTEAPQYHWGAQDGPTRTVATKPASFAEKAADTAISLGSGLLGGAKSLTDVFGADNSASQFLGEQSKNVDGYTSDERKAERAASQEKIKQAELYGSAWDEIKANISAFADAPIDIVVGAVGSSAPTLLSMFIPGLGQTAAARLVMGGIMGAAQGTGAGKGSIYEAVENKLLESGIDQDTAKKTAAAAQAYDGQNGGMIAANGIMGTIAGLTGVEGSLAKILGKKVAEGAAEKAAPGLIKTFAKGIAQESPIEGAQGGLERVSGNVALQNQGYDTPTFQGAAGQAAMESLASAPMGGGFALLSRNGQPAGPITPPNPLEEAAKAPGAVLSRAAIAPDDIAQRAHEIEGELKDSGGMQALRSIGAQHVAPFLEALSIAKDKRLPAAARQEALDTINLGMQWMADGKTADQPGNGSPFSTSLVTQSAPTQPGTDLATTAGGALTNPGMPQAFDPNTIDGEVTRVDNMLDGPKALPAPPGPALTNQTTQTPAPAGVSTSAPQEITNVTQAPQSKQAAQEGQEAPAAATPAVDTARTQVSAPKVSIPTGKGTAQSRKRRAQLDAMVVSGFDTVERRDDGFYLINHKSNEEMRLDGMGDAQTARVAIKFKMDADSHVAPSSPLNDKKAPSEAQIEAGNYHKPVTSINGFKVRIENPNGSTRSGTSPDGKKWSSTMAAHYGELEGTLGADGDKVDVFIGSRPDSDKIYVIDQKNKDGSFDEHKVMMGYQSLEAAKAGYLANYEKGWTGMGAVTEMGVAEFKAWVKSQEALKPVAYTDPKTTGVENDERGSDAAGAGLDTQSEGITGVSSSTGEGVRNPASTKGAGSTGSSGATQLDGNEATVARNAELLARVRSAIEGLRARYQAQLSVASTDAERKKLLHEISRLPDVNDPSGELLQGYSNVASAWERAFGQSVGAYVDGRSSADDGFQMGSDALVNLLNQQMPLQWTMAHEFKHLSEFVPSLKKLYDRIFSLIPQGARSEYLSYLHRTGQASTKSLDAATAADIAKLRQEMVADFLGQRFTDKAWLEQLAKQKPNLFGEFVRDWLSILNNAIHELISALSKGNNPKDIDRLMLGHLKQLQEMKLLAVDVATEWAERNPRMSKSTGASEILHSSRIDSINELGNLNLDAMSIDEDLDMVEFLKAQAEFDAQRPAAKVDPKRGGPVQPRADIADAEIQAHGLAAEDAYGDATWVHTHKSAVMLNTTARNLYKQGDESRIDLLQEQDGKWGTEGGIRGTWVGNDGMSTGGTTSLKMAQKFVSRFIASKDLFARKFDIAQTYSSASRANLLNAWNALNKMDGVRKYAKADKTAMSMKDIATQLGVTKFYDVSTFTERQSPTESFLMVEFTNKETSETQEANLTIEKDGDQRFATAHTGALNRNGLGGAFYQMAVEYAARNRLVIRPDDSLSGVNTYRRTEQMLASAMRSGKSNIMVPHSVQRVYGFQNDAKTQDEHDDNVVRLLLAGLRNARELAPEMGLLNYHPETDTFTLKNGKDATGIVDRMLANEDARAFGLGRSTLARAVLTEMALLGQLDVKSIQSIGTPLLYSAREDAELEYKLVEDQYKGTPQWMKAPDGSQTQLTQRQWVQVRTPQFKEWFGDWEKAHATGGVWATKEDVSKVVGSDGEPLVVYHGTDKGGFMAFNQPGGTKRGDLGVFTTSNEGMARSYVRKGRPQDMTPPVGLGDLEEIGYAFEQGFRIDGDFYDSEEEARDAAQEGDVIAPAVRAMDIDGYFIDGPRETGHFFATMDDAVEEALGLYDGATGISTIYAAFANIRHPNETNFEGALWGGERPEQYVVSIDGDLQSRADGKQYFTREEAEAFAKEHPNPLYQDDDGSDYIEPAQDHYQTTDDAVREGLKHGHDGTIIREVIDDGGGIGYDDMPSDVFVANKPEQLKSADWNTGEFGSSDDLRYSERLIEASSAQHQMEIEREEREIAATTRLSAAEQSSIAIEAELIGIPKSKLELEVRRIKAQFPASAGWAPMEFDKINKAEYAKRGVLIMRTVEFKKQPYDFHLGRDGKDDTSTHNKRVTSVAKGISDEIIGLSNKAKQGDKNAQITMDQIGWYSKVAAMLHHQFGGFADFLAQLMGPTSANTPVEGNVKYAMSALKSAMSGKWDGLIADTIRWNEGVMQAAAGLDAVIDANRAKPKAERLTGKALAQTVEFKDAMAVVAAAAPYQGEVPQQDSGAKFGMATQGVVEILAGIWSDFQRGDAPKTKNYYQNLIGRQFTGATIDVWAARTLRRMAGLLRLPTSAEKGVAGNIGAKLTPGAEFGFGQEAFVKAAENLRNSGIEEFANTTPADVQAMIWFSEKESWARSNWTTKIGEGGSAEAEFNLQGNADRDGLEDARRMARKGLPHTGSTKPNKTEEGAQQASINAGVGQFPSARETPQYKERLAKIIAKAVRARNEARVQFESMRGAADRWIAGVTPATDFTPTDATMAEVGAELESKVAMGEDAHKVLAFKALPTMGRYGYDERSIDFEGVTRQGYNGVDMLKPLLELAKDKAQDGLLFGRVLRADEDIDYLRHRPGLELYLAKGTTMEKAQPLLDKLTELGFQQFTFVVDPVRTPGALSGKMGDVVGLRYIFTPEFALREPNPEYGGDQTWAPGALTDDQIRGRMLAKADELHGLSDDLQMIAGVSSVERRHYEANVYFWGDYDNAIARLGARAGNSDSEKSWSGQPLRSGLEGADRRREMDSGSEDAKSFAARRDVLRGDSEPAFSRRDEGYSGRDGADGSVSIKGAVHYGRQAGLSVLSGSSSGTGIKGAEQDRLSAPGVDPRIKRRVYFYIPTSVGIPQSEIGLGAHVYMADLDGLYNPHTTTKPIAKSGNALETAVLDAGYKGYVNPEQGSIVVLDQDVPVRYAGISSQHAITPRVVQRVQQRIMTRLERSELVRKPVGNEMLQIIGARAAIDAAAPSFKLQYGDARVNQDESAAADGALASAGSTFQFGEARYSARDLGFYSELSAQMDKATMKQAPAGAWKSFIGALAQKGVKKDEVEWTGINDFLDLQEGKVSKEQIQEYLRGNGVQVEEVVLGDEPAIKTVEAAKKYLLERFKEDPEERYGYSDDADYISIANEWQLGDTGPNSVSKYHQYTLPGGENYREVLLTLPREDDKTKSAKAAFEEAKKKFDTDGSQPNYFNLKMAEMDLSSAQRNVGGAYKSSHWDQKNVLAHIRLNDRTDSTGARVLFVEEAQSDFQQDYRKSKEAVSKAVESDFNGIIERMKKAGVLEVNCD